MNSRNKYISLEGWLSILGNIILFGLKYWAGIVTGSLALIADAWHTLTDSVSSIIVLVGGKISQKPADEDHPFGHGRAEHIAAIIIGVLLAIIAFDFILGAIEKFGTKEKTIFGTIAWIVTIVSIIVKEGMAQYAFWAAKKTNSSILKADAWHHRTDALSSVVILIGIAVGKYFWWTDAVLGFVVALMIGWASFQILSKEINSLLGEKPSDELLKSIRETAQKTCKQPLHLHHIHIHNYGHHSELSCHIKLPPKMSIEEAHEICNTVEFALKENFGFISTIHAEPIDW
ncbi:MAG: cation transporter [Prolixibacteraceae bacterium]|jgi:cation diffusion facilitator family transporter|nr:cation transporter [Prolixibacteraceae bacterium]MBT6005794.1 cation transporter [Prolixibacteraceae bacterium]MBT6765019.1 cation transporter [Prolixibacteraceae bacterium]MBT6998753.1 cation transporter [Prolixibacteraceae bacterium]MBT7393413.1 cation transporter [Prolixibacteraceae bacterium]